HSVKPDFCCTIFGRHLASTSKYSIFMQPISNSLIQFATNIAQVAPKIVPALILVGIGLLIGKVID
ncbi:MAG TPA: hypothetical protein VKA09_10725, partial [Nitrososphaeraceae archaeon]|nr:hypothetical protein [Nitrososphaeraceae archaeon]